MPSEDSKPAKKEMTDDDDLDDRSLSSIMQARRKNPTNAGTLTPKSLPKSAKLEKEEDDFDQPIKPKGSSHPKPKITKVKKEDVEDDSDDEDEKPISKRISASKADKKELNNKKVKKNEEDKAKGSAAAEQNGKKEKEEKKKEKKLYDLPGQRRDPPEERDPLRIFYETLYEQVPNSEMAQFWMMESGLLPKDLAQKVYEKKLKKKNNKLSSPMKRETPTAKKANGSSTATKKKTPPPPSAKSKTVPSKDAPKDSKKRKANSDSDEDSDDDFVVNAVSKKQRAS
ncbi:hypothetical protein LINPERPRIM_LOCUS32602 [Linum perenne]